MAMFSKVLNMVNFGVLRQTDFKNNNIALEPKNFLRGLLPLKLWLRGSECTQDPSECTPALIMGLLSYLVSSWLHPGHSKTV